MSAPPPGSGRPSLADALQSVVWEYNEDEASLSPLVATIRYFESFPWEGTPEEPRDGGEPATGLDALSTIALASKTSGKSLISR